MNIGIVVAQFNEEITKEMLKVAKEHAAHLGLAVVKILKASGAYDLPLLVQRMLEDSAIQGIVTLGAVIRGDTAHDELIIYTLGMKLSDLSLKYKKPVSLGVMGPKLSGELAGQRIQSYAQRAVEAVHITHNELEHY